jgi:PHP family Zn ribbon phosphoesterase
MLTDLHIHSCLSPCASLEMSPRLIAQRLRSLGIGMAALTDHNCTKNCPAFADACKQEGIHPLFGMEITTAEEAHVLSLFGDLDAALAAGSWVSSHLLQVPLSDEMRYDQPIVDVEECVLGFEELFLIAATDLPLEAVVRGTHEREGLVIPCHLNRPHFSIESQLGFLPPGAYDAIEVLPPDMDTYRSRYPDYPVITSSDAHYPAQIGTRPIALDTDGSFPSLRAALARL